MDPWKLAQEKLKKALKAEDRKDFLFRPFADTYAAGGKAIIQEQPSDFWALDRGTYYTLEVKSCHQAKFYFKDIRPSQLIAAKRVPAAGGRSLFLIAKLPEWQWHCVEGQTILQIKESGEAGMHWHEMRKIKLVWSEICS